jgi:predicted DNA-binding protein
MMCRSATRSSCLVTVRAQEVRVVPERVGILAWPTPGDRCGWQLSPLEVIPGYTDPMKTAISLPDETFDRVSRRASDLGMSRSEFFTRAAQRYLDELDAQSLTGQINSALERLRGTDEAEAAAVAVGRRVLDAVDDEW